MSLEEIKRGLESLTRTQQDEVTAFLFHLRHTQDAAYQETINSRLADRDPTHWLTPEEFERRLDQGRR